MSGATLITCCYCGAEDIFKIHKGKRRTLACLSCGAPMRKMRTVRLDEARPAKAERKAGTAANPQAPSRPGHKPAKHHAAYHRKRKKRKSWAAELWDELDDIFDVEDWFD